MTLKFGGEYLRNG